MTRHAATADQATMFDLFDGTEAAPPRPVDVTKLPPAQAEAAIEAAEETALAEARSELIHDAPAAPIAPMPAAADNLEMFDLEEPWRVHWRGMPEYSNADLTARHSVLINFATDADLEAFAKLVGQTVLPTTRSIWYPEAEIGHMVDKRYAPGERVPVERDLAAVDVEGAVKDQITEQLQRAYPGGVAPPPAAEPELNDDIPF